jgi:hypothetical protein
LFGHDFERILDHLKFIAKLSAKRSRFADQDRRVYVTELLAVEGVENVKRLGQAAAVQRAWKVAACSQRLSDRRLHLYPAHQISYNALLPEVPQIREN